MLKRIMLWMIFLLLPELLLAQDNSLQVQFQADPSRNTTIGVFRVREIVYGSVEDLAEALRLGIFESGETKKIELKLGDKRLKFSPKNPFVELIGATRRQAVYQLANPVLSTSTGTFVSLEEVVPLINRVFDLSVKYERGASLLLVPAISKPSAFDISTLKFEPKANGLVIRIPAARPLDDLESWLKADGWLYVTIAGAKGDVSGLNKTKPSGLVSKIVAIQSATSLQLTFKLSGKIAAAEILKQEGSNDLLVSIREESIDDKILLAERQSEVMSGLENYRKKWELDVIVLDAGHGGHDPGAIGVSGVREKDITLAITRRLGQLIESQLKGVRVVYTRKDDRFIELDRRGQIANEAGGKLFVSIHGNSMPRKPYPTRGFEIYLLRPGRSAEAVRIAERENSVIKLEEGYEKRYKQLTDDNFILVTMAQSAHMKASEVFADVAQQEMESHLSIPNRGVKQAGFLVLVGASMPNVLVETAYLSNREDEKFVSSHAGQEKIAQALFKAIRRYKEEYEKLLTEGIDVGG